MKQIRVILFFLILFFISDTSATQYVSYCKNTDAEQISASATHQIIPVVTRVEHNAVMKITLTNLSGKPFSLHDITLSLKGTTALKDIESVSVFHADEKGRLDSGKQYGHSLKPAGKLTFKSKLIIEKPEQVFWVSIKLKSEVELTNTIHISCTKIKTSQGYLQVHATKAAPDLRLGIALRQHKDDGIHTYRIPGLATTKKGTLIALYDARHNSARDLQGDIDIAINRSFDRGKTWEPLQIVLDMRKWGGLPEKFNGVSDACILIDEVTGDIFIAGLWMHGLLDAETGRFIEKLTDTSLQWLHQWNKKGSQPGFDVKETSQFLITRSTDDGATWSEPENITRQVKKEDWWLFCPAPGSGITLNDGTLVIPTQGRDEKGEPFSNIIYSLDRGKTWQSSNPAYSGVNECMAVQLTDGSIMLNMRDGRNRNNTEINGRVICTTKDLGNTWTEHPTSRKALIEPTCMASLYKHSYISENEKKSLLLFCNPNSISKRNNITLKVSFDDGMTWPEDKWILLDELSGRGYSCITSVDAETIGVLYESSQADMVFQKIKISEIIK